MKIILSALFVLCFSFGFSDEIKNLSPELTKRLHELKQTKPTNVPIIKNESMEKIVSDFEKHKMPEMLNRVKRYKSDIASKQGYEDNSGEETCYEQKNLGDIELYVFISSSIPESTLKQYASELKKIPSAIMILNGPLGDMSQIMPTVNLLTRISCGKNVNELKEGNTNCPIVRTDLNPYLFSAFSIKSVPSFVISSKSYSEIMMAASQGAKISDADFLKMSGDTTLEYVLEHMKSAGVGSAAVMLNMLKEGYYK